METKVKKNLVEMLEEAFEGVPNVKIVSGEGKLIHIPSRNLVKCKVLDETLENEKKLMENNHYYLVKFNSEEEKKLLEKFQKIF